MSEAEMERLYRGADAAPGAHAGDPARRSRLERHYRRLLAVYPRDHRAEHTEEMLGVLLADAREGLARPGAGESVNLVAGALRIRLRRLLGCFGDARWRDALALASALAPLLAFAMFEENFNPRFVLGWATQAVHGMPLAFWWLRYEPGRFVLMVGWAVTLAATLLRRRRAALVAVTATVTVQALIMSMWASAGLIPGPPEAPEEFFLGLVTLVALIRSGGPRRAFEILGRWRTGLIFAGLAAWTGVRQFAIVYADYGLWGGTPIRIVLIRCTALAVVVIGVVVVALCARRPVGRRVLLLTAPAVSPFGVLALAGRLAGATRYPQTALGLVWLVYLGLAVTLLLLAVGGRRRAGETGPGAAAATARRLA